jgi:hypothetical protein
MKRKMEQNNGSPGVYYLVGITIRQGEPVSVTIDDLRPRLEKISGDFPSPDVKVSPGDPMDWAKCVKEYRDAQNLFQSLSSDRVLSRTPITYKYEVHGRPAEEQNH